LCQKARRSVTDEFEDAEAFRVSTLRRFNCSTTNFLPAAILLERLEWYRSGERTRITRLEALKAAFGKTASKHAVEFEVIECSTEDSAKTRCF
jgi:hypothetical protein